MKATALSRLSGLILLVAAFSIFGQERILSYHSEIEVAENASMTVEETIRVVARGDKIRRGIYRDFPTTYRDSLGNTYRVEFEMLDVTRDGKAEPWHAGDLSNGVRIYAGTQDATLSPGEYTYRFHYRTNRQIGYFDDHDELYWNVTGNGWDFSIAQASATVRLPEPVNAGQIKMEGYTGKFGDTGQNHSSIIRQGFASIRTTRSLPSRAGLTLVMSWPKGVVKEPGDLQRLGYLLRDNLGLLLALAALGGTIFYLYVMWSRYGRDPEPGVIFPHYEPPDGYSPAAARYISKMGYDGKALTAAVINLAVKGYLTITAEDGDYTLRRQVSDETLAPGEETLLQRLFVRGSVLVLDKKDHALIGAARDAHKTALKRDYLHIYFTRNTGLLLPTILGSVVIFFLILLLGVAVPLVGGIFLLIAILHVVFVFLLKAPSGRGRLLLDKLEGFKLYLEVAEKDDLNLRNPPEMTPELFERFLPFAIALGVEQDWSEQFSQVFAALQAREGVAYQPRWYQGEFSHTRLGNFSSSVGSNFSSAISSAATPPGSSSGSGGGGSSGGGGGGGGGGGW